MKRNIILFLFALCAMGAMAQSGMTDSQVAEFVMKEHEKGTSQAQIVTKLMQNGVDISQIRRVRKMYESQQGNGTLGSTTVNSQTTDRLRRNNGKSMRSRTGKDIEDETRQYYYDEAVGAGQYSNMRVHRQTEDDYTYDGYNGDFLEMQDEMNDWMPVDTAVMYEQLVQELRAKKKKVFGRDIFNNKNLTFEPQMNIATPQNYKLGPGDAVYIDIYGASQKSIETTVTPDGFVNIDGYGPVQVSGLTVAQANAQLKSTLGQRYSSSQIKLSVGQTRTIMVNVMGEVRNPGTYTLSAFASVFHALYMAGGPNELGSLRSVKVYRNNQQVSTVDVYDYILNGQLTGNIKLADNDVIVVGAYDCLVNIAGKVKRPMFYEMKRNESLGTLLRYAGGFAGDAYTRNVRIVRKTGRQYSVHSINEFDFNSFRVADGDSVTVDSVLSRYENMVEVKGAVFRPGMYQVGGDISTVRSLVEAAEGVTEVAFTPHAVMHRMKSDRTLEVISVDLEGILAGRLADIPLQNEDVLFVPTRDDAITERTINIYGEVQYPGTYKYADNTTLEDFILQAGGLKETASTVKVDVSRRIVNPKAIEADSLIAHTYSFAIKEGFVINGESGFHLQPFDEVYVRQSPGYNLQQNVEVKGQVMFAGTYTLSGRQTRLSDIIKAAGGPNQVAYIKGARLERKTNAEERKRMEEAYKLAQEQEQRNMMEMAARSSNASALTQVSEKNTQATLKRYQVPEYYPVGIELDKALENPGGQEDLVLREGDRITVPLYNGTVKINGAVMYANTVGYVKGKKASYYIDQAGGFANNAKKGNTYILYMNGMMAKAGHGAKIMPGCEIFVPTKAQNIMSTAERMTLGSGIISIATMVATLANVLK